MFEVNRAAIDYVTITSFNPDCQQEIHTWHESLSKRERESKRMQYQGTTRHDRYGTSFYGSATHNNRLHAMLQVSGYLADSAFQRLKPFLVTRKAKITRIDLQVTVEYDRQNWSQSDFADEMRDASPNRAISYIESKSGPQGAKLATVYYGSRISDKFARIYEKMGMGDEILLRLEFEYKQGRANEIAHNLIVGATPQAILWGEVSKMPDVYGLRKHFSKALETKPWYVRVVREPGDTERWLREKVTVALDRYLQQHDSDSQAMAQLFQRIISPHLDQE